MDRLGGGYLGEKETRHIQILIALFLSAAYTNFP
jgi:hypothetical protein